MSADRSAPRAQRGRLGLANALLVGLILSWSLPTTAAVRSSAPPVRTDDRIPETAPVAEVQFAAPTYFAVVIEPGTQRRRLYGVGDPVGDGPGAIPGAVVVGLDSGAVRLRDQNQAQTRRVAVGEAIPGGKDRRLVAIVVLDGIEYRYVTPFGVADPEPRVREIRERRALLDVDATPAAATLPVAPAARATSAPAAEYTYTLETRRRLDGPLLEGIRVQPTGRNAFAVNADDVQWALEHAGQVLQEAWGAVRPLLSLQDGLRFRVESPVADGVLGPGGFQVHSPRLAERVGLAAGDIVRSVNGQAINGFADLFRVYQAVRQNPRLSVVEVGIERQGQRLTKIYQIR